MNFEDLSEKLNGFNDYYERDLKEVLADIEIRRKKAFQNFLTAGAIIALIAIVFLILTNANAPIVAIGIGGLIVLAYFYSKVLNLRRRAKLSVLPIICDYLEFEYSYAPRINLLAKFRGLALIPSYDEEEREDEISGSLKEVDFWLQEVKLIEVKQEEDGESLTTVFKGLLCHFDFHKSFKGTTIGRKDFTALGNFFSGFTTSGERVKLEDPEFENKFEVFSTDQIEARYLLTPGFMQRVLDLLRIPDIKHVQFAFDDGKFYMAIESPKKFFEGGDVNLNEPEYVQNIINDIALVFDVVRTLNLTQVTKV